MKKIKQAAYCDSGSVYRIRIFSQKELEMKLKASYLKIIKKKVNKIENADLASEAHM